ncbi:MAG: pyridine nucleotide-disulfide oxidoreductase [Chloroflexota bacterium]|jgi:thioredoxin reductase|nr:pyridine nucleotide-disulfide oxidoreductase [Chloroflexota bacterium]
MAELTGSAADDRPSPPGDYPVVVIGSGPGGLQASYSLARQGIGHATISADPGPGGMFRRWPFFQRLLSWTKPHAPAPRGSRAYERFDWNSLLGDDATTRALQPEFMDGSSYFPSRPEMEANLTAFAERGAVAVRYGCRWTATHLEDGPNGRQFVVETTDGTYRAEALIIAVGVSEPYIPPGPGMEHARHYADVQEAQSYAGKRVFIVGKQNSGFEIANGLLPWARQLVLASPSTARLSVDTRSLVGVRARYVQPYEDHVLGGGVAILDAAIERIEPVPGGDGALSVHLRRTDGGGDLALEVDEVISATGFVCPLQDLPDLGVTTIGAARLPGQTAWWESTTVPGLFFAGTIGQGAKGLQRHGQPSNSGAVHGARYNARLLVRRLAETRFGVAPSRPGVAAADLLDLVTSELAEAPELWHQRGYLARVITADPDAGLLDDGVQPLSHVLDAGGPDALAFTLEADGTGAIYPVLYSRIRGAVSERMIDPDPLLRYDGPDARRVIEEVVGSVVPDAVAR